VWAGCTESLSAFDEARGPAYCVCSELPAQCGVVCAGELPSGPPALGSNPCIHMESVARDKQPAHYVGIVKLPYDLDVDAYPGAMQFSWG
jgi:hypothetical protein